MYQLIWMKWNEKPKLKSNGIIIALYTERIIGTEFQACKYIFLYDIIIFSGTFLQIFEHLDFLLSSAIMIY